MFVHETSKRQVHTILSSTSLRQFPIRRTISGQNSTGVIQSPFSSNKTPSSSKITNYESLRILKLGGIFSEPEVTKELTGKDCYKLKIVILNNYGNQSFVRCSEIDVFDVNNNKVEVFDIAIDDKFSLSPAKNLTNGKYGFNDDINDWIGKWSDKPIVINMTVDGSAPLGFVRFWKGNKCPEQSIREVEIYLCDHFVTKTALPKDLGASVSIKMEEEFKTKYSKKKKHVRIGEFVKDQYGEVPNPGAKTLEIDLYGNDGMVGLNQIEIYTTTGHRLVPEADHIAIKIDGVRNMFPVINLFKEHRDTSEYFDMWSGVLLKDHATLKFTFKKEVSIVLIRLFNHNSCYPEHMHQSSRATIKINDNAVWRGKLKQAHGISKGVSKYATNVVLSDLPGREKGVNCA